MTSPPPLGTASHWTWAAWGQQQCEILNADPGTSIKFLFAEGTLDTTITWTLETVEDGTILHLEHAGFRLDTPMGEQAFLGMGNGWPGVLSRIDGVLVDAARP